MRTLTGAGEAFEFDYMVKDHLGNVRAVLTDELQQDFYPAATLEGDVNDSYTAAGVEAAYPLPWFVSPRTGMVVIERCLR